MKTKIAFWDSSALIPLCHSQVFTQQASQMNRRYSDMTIWWGTTVEVYSGLARLKREAFLNTRQSARAVHWWKQLYSGAYKIKPEDYLLDLATNIPASYGLRAMDSFQLAAALVWCGERPRNRPFITADKRLGEAANNAGFDVTNLG